MDERECAWRGVFNARDVGGVPLAQGSARTGRLFRSGRTASLTTQGWEAVRAAGVRTVVDLRPERERGRRDDDPRLEPGALDGLRFVGAAVEDPDDPEFRALCDPYLNHPRDYGAYATLFAERIAGALDTIADAAGEGGVLVHCSAGRDRTGLVLALVLRASGASNETIADEDELATRSVNAHHGRRARPHPYERFMDDRDLAAVIASRRAAMLDWLVGLDAGDAVATSLGTAGALDAARRVAAVLGVCDATPAEASAQLGA